MCKGTTFDKDNLDGYDFREDGGWVPIYGRLEQSDHSEKEYLYVTFVREKRNEAT